MEAAAGNRQRFIHYLTHEIKTPLTSIIGYADLLRATSYNEDVFYKSLDYIYSEGKRLESLALKLMDLILVENNQPRLTDWEMQAVFEETAQSMKPQLEQAEVKLSVSAEAARRPMEKDLIKILCTNVIDNAIKASKAGDSHRLPRVPDGGRALRHRSPRRRDRHPRARDPERAGAVLKVDQARSRTNRGAGLGLAICAEIVRVHEGELSIRSRSNEGTDCPDHLPGLYN